MIKTYSELIQLSTFEERCAYAMLHGRVGEDTFGFDKVFRDKLLKSYEWVHVVRPKIINRDNGFDLGIKTNPIRGLVIVHHINPITIDDIKNSSPLLFDPENLICVSLNTHNLIHYGISKPEEPIIERSPWDTCPWRK